MSTPIEPDMVAIPAGPVTLGAPECPPSLEVTHRWRGPHDQEGAAFQNPAKDLAKLPQFGGKQTPKQDGDG